jgi:hypothetical protein
MNPYAPPETDVREPVPGGDFVFAATNPLSPEWMRAAAWGEIILAGLSGVPQVLPWFVSTLFSGKTDNLLFVMRSAAYVQLAVVLLIYWALWALLKHRSHYQRGVVAVMIVVALLVVRFLLNSLGSVFVARTIVAVHVENLFVGALILWLGWVLVRNPDHLWNLGRQYGRTLMLLGVLGLLHAAGLLFGQITNLGAGAQMFMLIPLLMVFLLPILFALLWKAVVGFRLFSAAADELQTLQAR